MNVQSTQSGVRRLSDRLKPKPQSALQKSGRSTGIEKDKCRDEVCVCIVFAIS